jgi:DegV family protein with EDD domain
MQRARVSVAVITDSACGLAPDDAQRLRIDVVPLQVVENGRSMPETGVDLRDLYARLPDLKVLPTTSAPSPAEFAHAFARAVDRGDDVLAVLISSKMSATFQSAETAASMIRERYPGARIELVDSESNSMQEGFAVLAAAECARDGGDLARCAAAARATTTRTRFLFAPRSLEYLARGGRISGAARLLGSALGIVPILTAANGTTGVAGVVRTHPRALARMAERMRADVGRSGIRRAVVQEIADEEGAARFARELIEPIAGIPVPIVRAPGVVGIHVGPAIGVVYETIDPLRSTGSAEGG